MKGCQTSKRVTVNSCTIVSALVYLFCMGSINTCELPMHTSSVACRSVMSSRSVNKKIYCCDPFRSHRRRIHARLRLVPLPMIKSHPSLGLRSGDRACCNCLNAIRKVTPEVPPTREQEEQAGPSNPSVPSTRVCNLPCIMKIDFSEYF